MAYTTYVYAPINWVNKTEGLSTPLGKTNLNHMDLAIYDIANNVNVVHSELSSSKLDKTSANYMLSETPIWDSEKGILTMRFYDGSEFVVDFNIEKIPVSFSMNSAGVITMETSDGTEWTADIGELIPKYTFSDTDTIAFSRTVDEDGNIVISAEVKKGSITDEHMETGYLEQIKSYALSAETSAVNSSSSAQNSNNDALLSQSYSVGQSGIRDGEDTDNSKYYYELSKENAVNADTSAINAKLSEDNAKLSEETASTYATNASESATQALESAQSASESNTSAFTSAENASNNALDASASASNALDSATNAKDSEESAKQYYEQVKQISESLSGALKPMGTVSFANLPSLEDVEVGDMYNISDEFTTTDEFKEGSGMSIPLGSNVFKTTDGFWDVLAGSPVTGIKGSAETTFRRGNVNITPENLGIMVVNNTEDSKKRVLSAYEDGEGNNISHTYATQAMVDQSISTLQSEVETNASDIATNASAIEEMKWKPIYSGESVDSGTEVTIDFTKYGQGLFEVVFISEQTSPAKFKALEMYGKFYIVSSGSLYLTLILEKGTYDSSGIAYASSFTASYSNDFNVVLVRKIY